MFKRMKEYLKFGAGRPLGTVWAMEKAYFEFRRKYPGKSEYAYLRLSLQSRYPEKQGDELGKLLSSCKNLDDTILKAIQLDFGDQIAQQMRMNVLYNLPACSRCGKYRALSTTDDLCYGCRRYSLFSACTKCHLYWENPITVCQTCGGPLWRITDGQGTIASFQENDYEPSDETITSHPQQLANKIDVTSKQSGEFNHDCVDPNSLQWIYCINCIRYWDPNQDHCPQCGSSIQKHQSDKSTLVWLASDIGPLNERCAEVYNVSIIQRKDNRVQRREEFHTAQGHPREQKDSSKEKKNQDLVSDIDRFCNSLCHYYLGADDEERKLARDLVGKHKYLLGNLLAYIARTSEKLKRDHRRELLALGLAAVSINDGRDVRDYDSMVGILCEAAAAAKIDPGPYLKMASIISNQEGTPSTRDFLLSFKPSASYGSLYWARSQESASAIVKPQKESSALYGLENLVDSTARQFALELFLKACNKRDTLFITDAWIAPRLERLNSLLSDPITETQATALKDVVFKRSKIDDLIEWLNDQSNPWAAFNKLKKQTVLKEKIQKEENEKREYEKRFEKSEKAWRSKGKTPEEAARNDIAFQGNHSQEEAKKKYLLDARSCPKCSLTPDKLAWFYFITPLPPYEQKWILHGFGGWMTFCDNCNDTVDFFDEERRYF
jgi:hypothetical protein